MKKLFYLIAVVGLMFASCTKPENPNPNEEKTYSFSIGAEKGSDDTDETRVEMIDGAMHWSVGDEVGIFIRGRAYQDRLTGIRMTGIHTAPTRTTTFVGELAENIITGLRPYELYGYVTFHIGGADGLQWQNYLISNSLYDEIRFQIPETFVTPKNQFNPDNVFMIASAYNAPAITWLENGTQKFGERITFTYKHVLSYLRVRIVENLSSKAINRIVVKTLYTGYNETARKLSGNFEYHIQRANNSNTYYGAVLNATNLSEYRIVNCSADGGINSGDYIYIPMPYVLFGSSGGYPYGLSFTFEYEDGSGSVSKSVNLSTSRIKTLLAGKVYDLSFKLP